ncbi:hypothetical protein CDEST_07398 [Colletotrichum destructivum]|uniref:MBL fold metallo-hydrolase n=1 Tax=Colletotrichum destructivum TaxID=34406 RepID=A0AAX4IGB6_9PEZI|nr:hypothetical protein CDEST_07398 [Colletotrichum destructivum]
MLTTISEGIKGHFVFIDTGRGTVILIDPPTGPKPTRSSQIVSLLLKPPFLTS